MGRTKHKSSTSRQRSPKAATGQDRRQGREKPRNAPGATTAYATCTGVRTTPPRLSLTIPPDRMDATTWNQIESALALPCLMHLAVMPDAHAGYDLCIGGVALLDGHISPSFVGYDIGCGICHVNTGLPASAVLPDEHARQLLFNRLRLAIPVGFDTRPPGEYELPPFRSASGDAELTGTVNARQSIQLATLGGGNHFLEVGVNRKDEIGVTVHSGSRRSGWDIGAWYMKQGRIFPLSSPLGRAYRQDMDWALDYALLNRRLMVEHALRALADVQRVADKDKAARAAARRHNQPPLCEQEISLLLGRMINENHNHAVVQDQTGPSGAPLVLHRKGATPADKGQPGIIPANQRDGVYITVGLGNEEYLSSASHGAGRIMSRNEAQRTISLDRFRSQMRGIVCRADKGVLDEAPDAYKPIDEVLAAQEGVLVNVVDHFRPLVVLKG